MKSKKILLIAGIIAFICIIATGIIIVKTGLVSAILNRYLNLGDKYLLEDNDKEANVHAVKGDSADVTFVEGDSGSVSSVEGGDDVPSVQDRGGNLPSNLVQNGQVAFDENNIYIINNSTNAIEVRNQSGKSTLFKLPEKDDNYHRYLSLNIYNDSVYVVSSLFGEGKIINRDLDGKDWEVIANGKDLQIYSGELYYIYGDNLISKSIESGEEKILVEDVYDYCISEGKALIRRVNAYDEDEAGFSYISEIALYILNLANNELDEVTIIKGYIDPASRAVLDGNFIYYGMNNGIECIDINSGETKNISSRITDSLEEGFCDGFAVAEEKIYIVFLDPNKYRPKFIVIDKANTEKFEVADCNLESYSEYLTTLYEWCATEGDPGWLKINIYYANHEVFVDRLGHFDERLNWLGKDHACDEPWTSYWE